MHDTRHETLHSRLKTENSRQFLMPAEWEPHKATWLSWPKDPETFPPGTVEQVEEIYIKMIEELRKGEIVKILVNDSATEEKITSMLHDTKNVEFHKIKSVDVWMRDYGPIFVLNRKEKKIIATKWQFNAWGSKYSDLLPDNVAGMEAAKTTGCEIIETETILEGGSIDNNGLGTCLTTEQCLLNKNRNPKMTKEEIEQTLKQYLGFTNIIWLGEGIEGDDTDGHVDDITRFVNKNTIVTMVEENTNDANHEPLAKNLELLKNAKDQDGKKFNVIPIQMPGRINDEDRRLPASYANFYIGNACVLVPIFNDKEKDNKALSILGKLFPDRKIVGIPCQALVYGYGGIHCVTQQEGQINR
ncbi:MAG: agmatine deiminase family protein [Candidatus Micrarchaeota archaeon]|nr:agmatine deiminase family protein [Candidatus Micrarchaeota archaeon]